MSYCRFGWNGSDVYVYESAEGWECCGCSISDDWMHPSPEAMIVHLAEHRRRGQYVPEYAISALWGDVPGPGAPVRPMPESMLRWSQASWMMHYLSHAYGAPEGVIVAMMHPLMEAGNNA